MEELLHHLKEIFPFSEEVQHKLLDNFVKLVLPKNEFIVTEGKICKHVYFIEQGCLHGFYYLNNQKITYWFGFENEFFTSFRSYVTQQPAVENIQLIDDSTVWAISKEALDRLLDKYHEVERLLRIAYERAYLRLDDRMRQSHFKSAAELYENLLIHKPHILKKVSLNQVALFLGISQETLSRIRNKVMNRGDGVTE